MPTDQEAAQQTAYVLRRVDGADRPVLVEQVYASWLASREEHRVRRYDALTSWPAIGRAWEKYQASITELIETGALVMCTNTDTPEHPEYHLAKGHEGYRPFEHGATPLVLRYLATPEGSVAWKARLEQHEQETRTRKVEQQQRYEKLRESAYLLASVVSSPNSRG